MTDVVEDSERLWTELSNVVSPVERLPRERLEALRALKREPEPSPYLLEPGLAVAAQIALSLRRPLLLTGDAGTGKTQFAFALANVLGLPLERCQVTSTTTKADLFYSIDDVSRFRDAYRKLDNPPPLQRYVRFNGLGRAILFAGGCAAALGEIAGRTNRLDDSFATSSMAPPQTFADLYKAEHFPRREGGQRVVVLVDEFDKAPRDTPNDMLDEIERMVFDMPEFEVRVSAPIEYRPIVIVTSNSERSLPAPFLRRCIYHHIECPDNESTMRAIVWHHHPFLKTRPKLTNHALRVFSMLRLGLRVQAPATAELIDWLRYLSTLPQAKDGDFGLDGLGEALDQSLGALVKNKEELSVARDLISEWRDEAA